MGIFNNVLTHLKYYILGRFSCTSFEQKLERERQKHLVYNNHVLRISEVTISHVGFVRADVIREHEIRPKWWRHLETTQFSDVHVHVHVFALVTSLMIDCEFFKSILKQQFMFSNRSN